MSDFTMIIGLIGQPSSGKDTAAQHLESRGFKHISTSDIIRDDMRRAGIPLDREHMHEFTIAMRAKHGPSYPASAAVDHVVDTIEKSETKRADLGNQPSLAGIVISGMRNTSEIEVLRGKFGKDFLLMAVDAPIELRYERARKRGRVTDGISFEVFKAQEDSERKSGTSAYQLDAIIAMADCVVENDGDEAHFFQRIDRAIVRA